MECFLLSEVKLQPEFICFRLKSAQQCITFVILLNTAKFYFPLVFCTEKLFYKYRRNEFCLCSLSIREKRYCRIDLYIHPYEKCILEILPIWKKKQ